MNDSKLAQFQNRKYLNLETFRKSGLGVPTPVWFVEDRGKLFVRTGAESGKVKRLHNNGRVRIAPCDATGVLFGDWIEAQARMVDGTTAQYVNGLIKRKYGAQKFFFDIWGKISGFNSATLEIILPD